jgi:hypothetical protein
MPKIEYVLWWLEVASQEMLSDPKSVLHSHTHPNYSGGKHGWEQEIHEIYLHPETLEEWLLACEVKATLEEAFKRCVDAARTPRDFCGTFITFDPFDIGEVYRLASLLALRDPRHVAASKVMMNGWCCRRGNCAVDDSLLRQVRKGFAGSMIPTKEFSL